MVRLRQSKLKDRVMPRPATERSTGMIQISIIHLLSIDPADQNLSVIWTQSLIYKKLFVNRVSIIDFIRTIPISSVWMGICFFVAARAFAWPSNHTTADASYGLIHVMHWTVPWPNGPKGCLDRPTARSCPRWAPLARGWRPALQQARGCHVSDHHDAMAWIMPWSFNQWWYHLPRSEGE